ncbi:hypothetical protein ACFVW9_26530 [Streptomyces sp. NPDC058217]|uniref:hypothetical protein n=1 Tax=Streptomyces sp. NPDC058217 TaxID=3346384 RepID=UPI0036E36568
MDAGLAAIGGAIVGTFATLGASLAAGWFQREGVRITARSEHRKQRHSAQESAYREFIKAATETIALLQDVHLPTQTTRGGGDELVAIVSPRFDLSTVFTNDFFEELELRESQATSAWIEVSLAGPSSVAEKGKKLIESIQQASMMTGFVAAVIDESSNSEDERARREDPARAFNDFKRDVYMADTHLSSFTSVARDWLDDDGVSRKATT